jgi:hypothetical protein
MANHPNRKAPGWLLTPVTPAELRALIEAAGITQSDAAARCHATEKTMRNWLAEPGTPAHRKMPLTASEVLALSLIWPGESRRVQPTLALVERWLRPQFAGLIVSFP